MLPQPTVRAETMFGVRARRWRCVRVNVGHQGTHLFLLLLTLLLAVRRDLVHDALSANAAIVQAPAGLIRRLAGDSEVVIASAADADRALLLWS